MAHAVTALPSSARPSVLLPDVAEADLREVSAAVAETCAALSLSLRSRDLDAAERLFGFLLDQIPDRRSALADVLRPLIAADLDDLPSTTERQAYVRTCRALLQGMRQGTSRPDRGVSLFAAGDGAGALDLLMVAVLLDDVRVPVTVVTEGSAEARVNALARRGDAVVCLEAPDEPTAARAAPLIRVLTSMSVEVVLVGHALKDRPDLAGQVGAAAGTWRLGEAADLILQIRGPLTSAESEVLRLAADGYTNGRIAHELGISLSAVKARLESSYARLQAADRTHAVAIALRRRWIR